MHSSHHARYCTHILGTRDAYTYSAVNMSPWHGLALLQQVLGAPLGTPTATRIDDVSALCERIATICPEAQRPASEQITRGLT